MPTHRQNSLAYLPPRDRKLVHDFFAAFATAEFRLKMLGFIRRGSEVAQADWDAFAAAIEQRFWTHKPRELAHAWRTLAAFPPRKQIIRDGRLGWKSTSRPPGSSDAVWGLLLVRRVRNNLFHGAKFLLGGSEEFARDRQLVSAAHTVLEAAMALARPRRRKAA